MPGLIEDYALIGEMRSAALISRDGSVDHDGAHCRAPDAPDVQRPGER